VIDLSPYFVPYQTCDRTILNFEAFLDSNYFYTFSSFNSTTKQIMLLLLPSPRLGHLSKICPLRLLSKVCSRGFAAPDIKHRPYDNVIVCRRATIEADPTSSPFHRFQPHNESRNNLACTFASCSLPPLPDAESTFQSISHAYPSSNPRNITNHTENHRGRERRPTIYSTNQP
jgi:hypothetical protein